MQNTVTISPDIIRDVARITALATPGVISLVEKDGYWRSRATSGIEAVLNNGYAHITLNVIGHTGQGDYGHGLDVAWLDVKRAKVLAVADADKMG